MNLPQPRKAGLKPNSRGKVLKELRLKNNYPPNPEKEVNMAVEEVGEKYRCNVCGNEVVVTKAGGGVLVCCGQEMEKIE